MPPDTLTTFVAALTRYRLLSSEQLEQCPRDQEPQALARELVRRGWLTPYQVNELFLDRGEGLILGSYVLLDKIGEGGMGTVYKARNWKLDKVVALKVIKKDRLLKPDTIKRFYREIRAVAQLDHPNIVRAFDADEVNETHFFVMEYVEGTDLSQLVKSRGPLPFVLACEYMRQAALGLQHAFERGLVHRDIKPHNLLLTTLSGGRKPPLSSQDTDTGGLRPPLSVVKILDMGLALIETPTNDDDHSSTMTHSGVVMGTPDYMAPEQSLNAHGVDIRADLYSLGCTLYFLLTGRAPFAGGTLTQKLMRHQTDTPESVKKVRPDVPEAIESLVRKLLAKRPEDRYQTPRELALTLEAFLASLPVPSEAGSQTAVGVPVDSAPSKTEVVVRTGWAEIAPAPAPGERPQASSSRLLIPMLASLAGLVLLVGGIWWATRPEPKPEPIPVVEPKPRPKPADKGDPLRVKEPTLPKGPVTDEWVKDVQALSLDKQAAAVFAKLSELNEGFTDPDASNSYSEKDGHVVGIVIHQSITDLSPVRALKHLESLRCTSRNPIVSLSDLAPLKGLPLKSLDLEGNRIEDLSPLAGMELVKLGLKDTWVRDLVPLKDMMHLRELDLTSSRVSDLRPLAGLKSLTTLILVNSFVEDLRPLANLNLSNLYLDNTDVRDLSFLPVSLTVLHIAACPVEDLTPLVKCPKLVGLVMRGMPFRALEPLVGMKSLANLQLSFDYKLAPILKRIPSLTTINYYPAAQFWKIVDPDVEQEKWSARVAALPADEQVAEALKRMRELNPDSKGEPKFKQVGGMIVEVNLADGTFRDLRFLAPFKKLENLAGGNTACLEPLRGLPLKSLSIGGYGIVDLSPLAGMPLEMLQLGLLGTEEGEALRSIPTLKSIPGYWIFSRVAPLAGLPLTSLPLGTAPRDLHLLQNMKTLEHILLHYDDFRHRDALKAMSWLKTINGKKPDDFWKEIAEQQVEFVRRELVRLNGELTKFEAKIDKGFVTTLAVKFKQLNDLKPLRTLTALTELWIWGEPYQARPLSLEPLRGLPLDAIWLSGVTPENLDPLRGKKLGTLSYSYNRLNDLSLLKGVSVRHLRFNQCKEVSDLSPLRGMALESLGLDGTAVKDLSPLQNMPLSNLGVSSGYFVDLTPVAGIKTLRSLTFSSAHVQDLRCLEALPLESLNLRGTKIVDLSPLIKLKLQRIGDLDFQPFRGDADVLRAIPTLQLINHKNAKEFLKEADDKMASFQKWCDDVAKLSGKSRVDAVIEQLKIRNPDWKDTINRGLALGGIVEVKADGLTDPTPLRALPSLRQFGIGGENLNDLWFLHGMKVEGLNLHAKKLEDLTPLRGVPLKSLSIQISSVSDLSPLRGMPLEGLAILHSPVADLRPLRELPHLKLLHVDYFKGLTDLSPLQGLSLETLSFIASGVVDLTPLRGMPLTKLQCDFVPMRDAAILKEIKTLKTLNGKSTEELLK